MNVLDGPVLRSLALIGWVVVMVPGCGRGGNAGVPDMIPIEPGMDVPSDLAGDAGNGQDDGFPERDAGGDPQPESGDTGLEDLSDPGGDLPAETGDEDVNGSDSGDMGPGDPAPDSGEAECVLDEHCQEGRQDPGPCRLVRCVEGRCVVDLAEDGEQCDDQDPCTWMDRCWKGVCTGTVDDCDDRNPCTEDRCEAFIGCIHEALSVGLCSDGSACTEGDRCVEGVCQGDPVACDDDNPCTEDFCDRSKGCLHSPRSGLCDDRDGCTIRDHCEEGKCRGTALDCNDGNPCTDDRCEEGTGCIHEANRAPCDDRNPCTDQDACSDGVCRGRPVACETPPAPECLADGSAMVTHSFPGTCIHGTCVYERKEIPCDRGCVDGTCLDEDACTKVRCEPPWPCLAPEGTCVAGRCIYSYADGEACEDGNACTFGEACHRGVCAGLPVVCNEPPGDWCENATSLRDWQVEGLCDEATGECRYRFVVQECIGGCVDGACLFLPGLWQAEMTPAGRVGMSGRDFLGACVVQPVVEGMRASSAHYTLDAGFEP